VRFRCWVPDEGYTRMDASDVEATDAEEAAEFHAERWYRAGERFQQLDVRVAPWGSGNSSEVTYRVTVDFDPSFSAVAVLDATKQAQLAELDGAR